MNSSQPTGDPLPDVPGRGSRLREAGMFRRGTAGNVDSYGAKLETQREDKKQVVMLLLLLKK